MLTLSQLQALKADILADPVLTAIPNTPDGAFAIADAYNLVAAPAFIVWKTAVTEGEILQNGFDWVRVDNLTVGKSRIWEWMFKFGTINASKPNIRQGIAEVWKGTAADVAVQAVVLGHCKRSATRAEKLFATGTGTEAVPATLSFEGALRYQDVLDARAV